MSISPSIEVVIIVALAYFFVIWPSGFFIGRIMSRWPPLGEEPAGEGLLRAGRWIGYLERIIIVTFVFLNQFLAIGLLITAKLIFRFNSRKTTEYYLIGTLLSLAIGLLVGIAADFAIKML